MYETILREQLNAGDDSANIEEDEDESDKEEVVAKKVSLLRSMVTLVFMQMASHITNLSSSFAHHAHVTVQKEENEEEESQIDNC